MLPKSAILTSQDHPGFNVWRNIVPHTIESSCAQKDKVALFKRTGRDVADEYVGQPITIQVSAGYTHAFKRIMAKHFGRGSRECLHTLQPSEMEMPRCRAVVQEPVGPKIIGKVEFGKEVVVEITCRNRIAPTVIRLVV
jgi:hypothetical protein